MCIIQCLCGTHTSNKTEHIIDTNEGKQLSEGVTLLINTGVEKNELHLNID
jgi:hypothetical protein